jgi:chromosomal replication initiator protein
MSKKKDIWARLTRSLQSAIPQSEFRVWFACANLKNLTPDQAIIEVPNKFIASWLKDNYLTEIEKCFETTLSFLPEIRFTYTPKPHTQTKATHEPAKRARLVFPHQLNPSWTFANFITAKSNRFAYSSALEVANKPAQRYNPLYIFSRLSCGKTHLLNAIGNHVLANNPMAKVRYISAAQFSSDFSLAARNEKTTEFRTNYNNLDLLLLDDIHLVAGREKTQKELVNFFNVSWGSTKQITISGNRPPSQIPNLNPELRSRMQGGLLSEIGIPNQKTKMKIIKKKTQEEKLHIPEDAAFFLANTTRDLKTLMHNLVSLETYVSLYHREIDLSTVKSIVKDRHLHNLSLHDIQKLTAQYFDISLSDLISNKKGRRFSYPRQIAMYLSRKLTAFSLKEIGKAFGNKDHSTVIYAVNRVQRVKDLRQEVLDDIKRLEGFLS